MSDVVTSAVTAGQHPGRGFVLHVFAKATYRVEGGALRRAPEQLGLCTEPLVAEDDPARMLRDTDLLMFRQSVDLHLIGCAYGRGARSVRMRVALGPWSMEADVLGARRCERRTDGGLFFTEPEPFERVALIPENAYGGVDTVALATHGDPLEVIQEGLGEAYDARFGTFAYPRNPFGCGYLIEPTDEAIAALRLPTLELPARRLDPATLALGEPLLWPRMPTPALFGWLGVNVFPRDAQFGMDPPPYDPDLTPADFPEVALGLLDAAVLGPMVGPTERFSLGAAQSAPPLLRVPAVVPGDVVLLDAVHPQQARWSFVLPEDVPRVALQVPGQGPEELVPVVRAMSIEPELDRVTITWVAERPCPAALSPGALEAVRHAVTWRMT